ncbi:hypothetical protein JOC36_001467 [Weissella uvarum]|uniref:hypothetical protein n=1 Tax=Weissella uvarum TaxID=1479233 RepID=UPI0019605BDC|nr:hypothetical protein [Weissella uvarum]MBM7617874.1 hypothetical protein [Weissella uvarum]MCM0596128.1 hypothetical protein [Weissella uvarum]
MTRKTYYVFKPRQAPNSTYHYLTVVYTSQNSKDRYGKLIRHKYTERLNSANEFEEYLIGYVEDFVSGEASFGPISHIQDRMAVIRNHSEWFEEVNNHICVVSDSDVHHEIVNILLGKQKVTLTMERQHYVLIDKINGRYRFVKYSHGRSYTSDKPVIVNGSNAKKLAKIHKSLRVFLYQKDYETAEDYVNQ